MSPIKRIILHVGQAKAASTAFQNLAEANHDALLSHGILFPLSVLVRQNKSDPTRTPGHLDLLKSGVNESSRVTFLHEVATCAEAHTVLLSVENIFHTFMLPSQPDLAGFLHANFPQAEIELLAVLRHPLGWLRSLYYELVMGGRCEVRSIADFAQQYEAEGVLDYAEVLDSLAKTYGATKVEALDFADQKQPVVPALFKRVDPRLDMSGLEDKAINVSVSVPELVSAKRCINLVLRQAPLDLKLDVTERIKAYAQEKLVLGVARKNPERLTAVIEAQLLEAFKPRRKRLADKYMSGRGLIAPKTSGAVMPADAALEADFLAVALRATEACLAENEDAGGDATLLDLTPTEFKLLSEQLVGKSVSLHLGWPDSAVLAACHPHRLVISAGHKSMRTIRSSMRTDQSNLPSEVLEVPMPDLRKGAAQQARDIKALWNEPFFRAPDLVAIGAGMPVSEILKHLAQRTAPIRVLLQDAGQLLENLPDGFAPTDWVQTGRLAVFTVYPTAALVGAD